MGRCGVVPAEGVAGKRQYGGWNKGNAFPSMIMNITTTTDLY